MAGRFVLKKSLEQFHVNLKAGNNEVTPTSERYTAKASALGGIEAVKTNAPQEARYETAHVELGRGLLCTGPRACGVAQRARPSSPTPPGWRNAGVLPNRKKKADMAEPNVTIAGVSSAELPSEVAYAALLAEILAVENEDVTTLNIDPVSAITTVPGVLPERRNPDVRNFTQKNGCQMIVKRSSP